MTVKKKLAFMLIDITPGEYPLVPACLSGYARLDSQIKEAYDFQSHSYLCKIASPSHLEEEMEKIDAHVYAFSCYVWNMGVIKRALETFPKKHPDRRFLLGGPQAAFQAKRYLNPECENVAVCNGEGEVVFRNYLKELMKDDPDFRNVKGLAFYKDGQLEMTDHQESIDDLDDIPSPFFNDIFNVEGYYTLRMETNRNCPFTCKYCYWGNQGTKPKMFGLERIKSDIQRIAMRKTPRIHITDANFGIFKRDVEITEFIVWCKKKYGFPEVLIFPPPPPGSDRYLPEICKILLEGGIDFNYEIGLQSLSPAALKKIRKKYIFDDYKRLQNFLNKNRVNSRIDLIWPLPGETLDSYKQGIAKLCEAKADTIIFLPLLLLNNTALQVEAREYGLETRYTDSEVSEEQFVIQTKETGPADYLKGLQYSFGAFMSYNLRSLYLTGQYLNDSGIETHEGLISDFTAFVMSNEDIPEHFTLKALAQTNLDWFTALGRIAFEACHGQRDVFDQCLFQFASSRPWWDDREARFYFEADILNRAHLYLGETTGKSIDFNHIEILEMLPHGYVAKIPASYVGALNKMLGPKSSLMSDRIWINHEQSQTVYNENASLEEKLGAGFRMTMFNQSYLPVWESMAT